MKKEGNKKDQTMETLALNGGKPIRTEPLPRPYIGASLFGEEELTLLTEVVKNRSPFRDSGLVQPHMVIDFEKLSRGYFDVPYAMATSTGSGSFYCAMAALGVGPGDEVLIPSLSWHTDFMAPVHIGATPVFVDIDHSLNMCPVDFERKITARTKAVIVVHYQGATNDMATLMEIAKKRGIKVVEDVAQAWGAEYKGRKVGSIGDISCFSFQLNKILTTGDGGLLLAKDPILFERAARYHDLGGVRKGLKAQLNDDLRLHQFCGLQFRMNEMTGAVALAQLRKLDSHIVNPTRQKFHKIKNALKDFCPGVKFRHTGDDQGDVGIALYIDFQSVDKAEWFEKAMTTEGIRIGPSSGCGNMLRNEAIVEKRQVHPALPPFGPGCPGENVEYKEEQCPNTDSIFNGMRCVGLLPTMTDQDVDDIINAVVKVWPHIP